MQLATDNTTAMHYVNKEGGTHSLSLLYLTIDLWEWCYQHHVFPIAVHISTEDNYVADLLSRLTARTHEWTLNDSVFLCRRWGTPDVHVFASTSNKKCKIFCSRAGVDIDSIGNMFMMDWSGNLLYLFPPILLIQWTIIRLHHFRSSAILITPWWPRQP